MKRTKSGKHRLTMDLDKEDYTLLKKLADEQERSVSGQAKVMLKDQLDRWKE